MLKRIIIKIIKGNLMERQKSFIQIGDPESCIPPNYILRKIDKAVDFSFFNRYSAACHFSFLDLITFSTAPTSIVFPLIFPSCVFRSLTYEVIRCDPELNPNTHSQGESPINNKPKEDNNFGRKGIFFT